jgi:hypothetical protein
LPQFARICQEGRSDPDERDRPPSIWQEVSRVAGSQPGSINRRTITRRTFDWGESISWDVDGVGGAGGGGHDRILAADPPAPVMIAPVNDTPGRPRAWPAPPRRSIVELIADGVLDAELAALAWLLIEARLPVVVGAMARGVGKTTLLEALLDFLPASVRRIDLAGAAEDFAWLPEAAALGWPPAGPTVAGSPPIAPTSAYLVAAELSEHLPIYTWGAAARTLVRAASIGYGIGATIHADRLEDIHDDLRERPVGLTDDELSYLGLIVIARAWREPDGEVRRRVVAAHYARPVGRDEHGHVQRLPPAVIAARDEASDALEHFAWGVMPELAIRLDRKAGDLERDQADRAALLGGLVAAGTTDVDEVRGAIRSFRAGAAVDGHRHIH